MGPHAFKNSLSALHHRSLRTTGASALKHINQGKMIKRVPIVRAEGKTARYFVTLALAAAVATNVSVFSPTAFGHGGDDHDKDLDTIPTGPIQLLPDTHKTPHLDGVIGPVLPMHAMSVHNTLVWKKNKKLPLMLMFHRHSGYRADEVMNPDVVDFLILNRNPSTLRNAFADVNNQFNSAFRRTFNQFAYGGYNIVHDVSQSVPTRISIDQTKEITQLWDMNHPDAFKFDYASPPYSSAAIVNADAELNGNAFYDAGPSRGMYYDMYCPGFSTLADGRAVFMGGHDLNSQNGNYRIQVFDPENESWALRPASCMRKYFGRGISFDGTNHGEYRVANLQPPTVGLVVTAELPATSERYREDWNLEIYYRDKLNEFKVNSPSATDLETRVYMRTIFLPNCNPHDLPLDRYSPTYPTIRLAGEGGTVTNPGNLDSDMKYARWYPTQITLPGNKIYIYAGWDRDESKYSSSTTTSPSSQTTAMLPFIAARKAALEDADPNNDDLYDDIPVNADLAGSLPGSNSGDFEGSRVKQVVGEVYDPATDKTIALENAPFFHNAWYPSGIVVQTGPGRNDWKVVVNDGDHLGKVKARTTDGATDAYRSSLSNSLFHNIWLFDIQAAMKDPNFNNPPGDSATTNAIESTPYHTFLSNAASSHSEFTGNANIVELDKVGRVISHKLVHMGGTREAASSTLAQAAVAGDLTLTVNFDGANDADKPGLYTVGTGGTSERVYVTTVTVNPQTSPTKTGFPTTATLTLRAPGLVTARAANVQVSINGTSDTAEEIDFANLSKKPKRGEVLAPPQWKVVGQLYQPGRQNYCTPLPDGTVLILGGNGGILPSIERWSLHTQLYDPSKAAGYTPTDISTNSVRTLAKSLIPRDEHGIIQLMPDATVYLGGQNRNGLVQAGDSFAVQGDPDLGVPCAQLLYPPYLYDKRNEPAERPVMSRAPAVIDYGKPFKISTLARKKIKTVSIIRSGSMSHSINTDVRMVKLAFKQSGSTLTVYPPKFEGTAIGGYYQMFIVDEGGVPSKGVKVQLGQYITKRIGKPVSKYVLLDETGQ